MQAGDHASRSHWPDVGLAVTAARTRDLALALGDTAEAPRFHRTAFRTPRRIFATLDASVPDLDLMFDPALRDF